MKIKGITLIELLIVCVIMGIIGTMAASMVLKNLPAHEVAENIKTTGQALVRAKSLAVKESRVILADFSEASSNHNGDGSVITGTPENESKSLGGKIEIKRSDGTVLDTYYLSYNNKLNNTGTTILNNQVRFDYLGEPVDGSNSTSGFTESHNTINISAYRAGSAKASKSLSVTPMTGSIVFN